MSVILMSAQKKKKKKQSNEDKDNKNHAQSSDSSRNSRATLSDPRDLENSYLPNDDTVVWNFQLHGKVFSLALLKSSLTVWCNDVQLPITQKENRSNGVVLQLQLVSPMRHVHNCEVVVSYKTTTTTTTTTHHHHHQAAVGGSSQMKCKLFIDGDLIPQTVLKTG